MKHGIACCATVCVLAFLAPPVGGQSEREPLPKEDLQLLSSAAAHIKNDYWRAVEEPVLVAGCAESAAASGGIARAPQPGAAADLTAIPKLLMDLKWSAASGTTYRMLAMSCIEGMVAKLDAHSKFLGPEEYRELQVGPDSRFPAAVGLELRGGGKEPIMVMAPIEGTPAARAGIRGGDRLMRVDGANVEGKDLKGVVQALRGKTGSDVTLTLRRGGAPKLFEITVKREIIRVPAAGLSWVEPGILHIRITQFRFDARRNLLREIEKFIGGTNRVPAAILLDLRENQGGVLADAMDVAGVFLPDGVTIGSVKGRGRDASFEIKANVRLRSSVVAYRPELPEAVLRSFQDAPMIVLVDGRTASGAEMVAAALRENGRARLVGAPTLGMGSIQTIFPLTGGATALKLTQAIWYTPKNRPLDGDPLLPDVPIETVAAGAEADAPDRGLQEAVRQLSARRTR